MTLWLLIDVVQGTFVFQDDHNKYRYITVSRGDPLHEIIIKDLASKKTVMVEVSKGQIQRHIVL